MSTDGGSPSNLVSSYVNDSALDRSIRSDRSAYHETCVPNEKRSKMPRPERVRPESEFSKCDQVTQDIIWKQAVKKETNGVKSWEENWGFLSEFDGKGRQKTPKKLPDRVPVYSDNVPNTNAGNYGARLGTEPGRTMQALEFRFNSHRRRRKLGTDMVCY